MCVGLSRRIPLEKPLIGVGALYPTTVATPSPWESCGLLGFVFTIAVVGYWGGCFDRSYII